MCIVGENVIDDALHVPRVRTTGHVPSVGPEGVHRWDDVPLDTDDESEEERHSDHDARPVCVPKPSCAGGFVLAAVGPSTPLVASADHVDDRTDEEGEGEPNQCAPATVKVLVVPHSVFVSG